MWSVELKVENLNYILKMKKYVLFIGLCFLILFRANAASDNPWRTDEKSFSGISQVNFDHSYGNIVVIESDVKQVELKIQYFDEKNNKSTCEISTSGNTLFIKTVNPPKRNSFDKWRIDYVISVPQTTNLTVALKYGNIKMGDFSGDFKAELAYSNLNAGILSCPNPIISCQYGHINMDGAENLSITTRYSFVNINKLNTLKVDNQYSDYKIDKIGTIYEGSSTAYGNFNLNMADDVNLKLQYSNLTIGTLGKNLKTSCSYGGVVVQGCAKQLENINVKGSFSDVTLNLYPDLSANFDINVLYGGLDIAEKYNPKFTLSEKSDNRIIKKGTIGAGNPTANISISNTYAGVKIK